MPYMMHEEEVKRGTPACLANRARRTVPSPIDLPRPGRVQVPDRSLLERREMNHGVEAARSWAPTSLCLWDRPDLREVRASVQAEK